MRAALLKSPAVMTKNLSKAIKQTIFFTERKSVQNAPKRTGTLAGSVYRNFAPLQGEIGFKAKYAIFVHEGTSPYTIRPRGGQALFWKGASHPVRRVNHPGIKANPFLRRAIENNQPQIDEFFNQALQDTLDVIAKAAP